MSMDMQHWKDEDDEVSECEGKLVALLKNVDLKDRLSDDLRDCGDFSGDRCGEEAGYLYSQEHEQ